MIRYLLVTMMIMLTPPKGSGGLPHAPRHAVVEARDSYFLINDRNVFSLCLAECSDYDLYELVHNIDTDSDQGK